MSATAFGATLDATLMTPTPPTAIIGKVSESSPDSTSILQRARIWLTRSTLPPASLTATMFGCFESSTTVPTSISRADRPGML